MTNRERLIKLIDYLYKFTDDEHPVTTGELTQIILGEDSPAKRKTIKADIDVLEKSAELDIIRQKGASDRYNWGSRLFDMAEIKFLIDCVSASGILTESMSRRMIKKLQSLLSVEQSEKLISRLYIPKHLKTDNQQIFYTVDKLTDAINKNRKVAFRYWKYGPKKEKTLLANGEDFICSPYGLALENSRYYLVGYSESMEDIAVYRIDRIRNLRILAEETETPQPGFQIEEYLSGAFRMFQGEHEEVLLECHYDKMSSIIDYFGQEVEIIPVDEEYFRVAVKVKTVDTFYAWIFQSRGKLKILGPESVKNEYYKRVVEANELIR